MNRFVKSTLMASVAIGVFSTAAYAQDVPAVEPEETVIDSVVVTARRREETLKDVPVAVTALSATRLEETGATDITALQQQTPNATVQVARGSNSTLISFIRGVGQQDPLWGFEPGVGLYVDDVYIARPQGAVLDIFDIERIEVLRGPQGTLYGRNTVGGAVKYVTDRMGTENEAALRASVGSYGQFDVVASGQMPITDTLSIGGAWADYSRDGFGKNLNTGRGHYDKSVEAGRASIEWAPSSDWFFRLAYDQVTDKSNPRHGHREVSGVGTGATILPGIYDTNAGIVGDQEVKTEGVSFTGEYVMNDNITLKSISAWREGDTTTVIDFDGTAAPTLDIPAFYADKQFTQELQALFDFGSIQGVAGLFYLDATAEGAFDTILGNAGIVIGTAGEVETQSLAAFADVNWDITDRLHLSLGARWTDDEKTGTVYRANYLGATRSPWTGGVVRAPILLRTDYTNTRDFQEFTPRVALSYDLTDDLTGYASYSRGFKSGGFDMRGDAILTPDTVDGYDPETVDAYEIGLKGSALDGRMFFSSAIFYSQYEDQQVTTQVPAGASIASFVDNVGNSTIYGAEFESSFILSDNFSANLSLGYLEAEFDEFIRYNLGTAMYEDISDQVVFQNSPKWSGFFGVTYSNDFAGGEVAITPSISYRDDYSQFEFPNPLVDQEAFTLVDFAAIWTANNDRWSLSLVGKNLTEEEYKIGAYAFPGALFNDSTIAFYGPPRTWTASIGVKF